MSTHFLPYIQLPPFADFLRVPTSFQHGGGLVWCPALCCFSGLPQPGMFKLGVSHIIGHCSLVLTVEHPSFGRRWFASRFIHFQIMVLPGILPLQHQTEWERRRWEGGRGQAERRSSFLPPSLRLTMFLERAKVSEVEQLEEVIAHSQIVRRFPPETCLRIKKDSKGK